MYMQRRVPLHPGNRRRFNDKSCLSCLGTWDCCGICQCFRALSFGWKRRRHVWRARLFYSSVTWLICFGALLTTTLLTLIDSRTFFWNYRCSGKAVRLISLNFAGMLGVTGLTGLAALLMARLTGTFSNYSVSDMMAVGKCSDRLGLLVKWVPWFTAACMVSWMIFNLVNLIWIIVEPRDWCSRRWAETGIQAVTNCRMWYTGKAPCVEQQQTQTQEDDTRSCNDAEFLAKRQFFWFTPNKLDGTGSASEPLQRCSFEAIPICLVYLKYFSSSASADSNTVDWNSDTLKYCMGKAAAGLGPETFQRPEADTSDLYKYITAYVIGWNAATLVIVCFFYYIKFSSNFESMFYQPPITENFFYSLFRPLTPWTS